MLPKLIIKYILIFCKPYGKDCKEYMYACINPDQIGQYSAVYMRRLSAEDKYDICMGDFLKQQ